MTDDARVELWRRAQELLGEALELPHDEQEPFLVEAAAGDDSLLSEVRSLLEASRAADDFFDGLAGHLRAVARPAAAAESLEGRSVGHYDVGELVGRGGMGEVYRALDRRLGREVALKALSSELARDEAHVARFRREARIVAALNHPNIAHIHGIEELDGRIVLVLELVEGPTLKDRLAQGRLPVGEALEVALDVARALEAAHERGVVHRDLKPSNVKAEEDGRVRVLDFGIAKLDEPMREAGVDSTASPAPPTDVTRPGTILGTVTYMSPEQARGRPIDRRSDVWAFGALLFEMLSGRKAFPGADSAEVMARILEAEPDWSLIPGSVPTEVRNLLRRCLVKRASRRLQAMGEARIVLEDVLAGGGAVEAPMRRGPATRAAAGIAVFLAGAAVALAVAPRGGEVPPSRTLRLAVAEDAGAPVLAPTGDRIAFMSGAAAWVVFLDGTSPRELPTAEGGYAHFWSPDGEHLGFMLDGAIRRVPAAGGQASVVGRVPDRFSGAAWLSDGTIVAALVDEVVAFPESGGQPVRLWEGNGESLRDPTPGPEGSLFLVSGGRSIVRLEDGVAHEVYRSERGALRSPAYAPPGHLLFQRTLADVGIWALPVDARGDRAGAPFLVTEEDRAPSASRDGALAYLDTRLSRQQRSFVWVDRTGATVGVVEESLARLEHIDLAPSGRRAVAAAEEGGRRRIWVVDLETGDRFALSPMPDPGQRWPSWSPDEQRIAFRYDREGAQWVGIKELRSGAAPVGIAAGVYPVFDPGGALLYNRDGNIYRRAPDPFSPEELYLGGSQGEGESQARPSANGLLAFLSMTETGVELFVTRSDRPDERWQVSESGGARPRWRADGRELFFLAGESVMAASIAFDGDVPLIGRPQRLFGLGDAAVWGEEYDVNPDGQRFLMVRALPRESIEDVDAIVLVQRWADDFVSR